MRRCGHNPTDVEVSDIINKIHDDTGSLDLEVLNKFSFTFDNLFLQHFYHFEFSDMFSIKLSSCLFNKFEFPFF